MVTIQSYGTMAVWFLDHHLVWTGIHTTEIDYRSAIQMPGTMVLGIWIANHLKNEQVKVQILAVFIFLIFTKWVLCEFYAYFQV